MSVGFLQGASCVMCGRGVHDRRGRVACDGCGLPTDCCLCEVVPGAERPKPPPEIEVGPRALPSAEPEPSPREARRARRRARRT